MAQGREVRAELGRTQEAPGARSGTQSPAGEAQGTSQRTGPRLGMRGRCVRANMFQAGRFLNPF